MKKNFLILLVVLIISSLIYGGIKLSVYIKVKSFFPYSWNKLDQLEKTPPLKNFELYKVVDTERKNLKKLIFHLPHKEIIKDTFSLNRGIRKFKDSTSIYLSYNSDIEGSNYINLITDNKYISTDLFENYLRENNIFNNYWKIFHINIFSFIVFY